MEGKGATHRRSPAVFLLPLLFNWPPRQRALCLDKTQLDAPLLPSAAHVLSHDYHMRLTLNFFLRTLVEIPTLSTFIIRSTSFTSRVPLPSLSASSNRSRSHLTVEETAVIISSNCCGYSDMSLTSITIFCSCSYCL